ncbi:hypothetical protein BDR05DRAFT_1006050 [Suillus weaverae]|nr:hypothetical protein BDR05DRAFT_1006050 [Suillus weaverae]
MNTGVSGIRLVQWQSLTQPPKKSVVRLALQVYNNLGGASTSGQESDGWISENLESRQLCTPIEVASFLTTPWMVQEVYACLPMLRDVLAWQDSSCWTRSVGQSFVLQRFTCILRPFIGDHVPALCSLMYTWGVVITGSCALEMLMGQHHATNNLNLIVPQGSFTILKDFIVETLCYQHNYAVSHPHHAFCTVVQTFAKYGHGKLCITLSEARTEDVFDVVTSSPTMGDMIFMTPGGVASFYPDLTLEGIVLINSTLTECPPGTNYVGCMKHARYKGDMPSYIGILYATRTYNPELVPILLRYGLTHLKHINNLEVLHWVDCLGDNKFNIDMACARKTYNVIVVFSSSGCGYGYTFFREHPALFAPPNALIADITADIHTVDTVTGNVLVIKHINGNKHEIVNLTIADLECLNEVLRRVIGHAEF